MENKLISALAWLVGTNFSMIKFLRLTTIFLIFWGCSSTSGELANYFEPTQIQELSRLTEFVTRELTDNCSDGRTTCLNAYFDQYKESGYDFELTGISKNRQSTLLNSLLNQLTVTSGQLAEDQDLPRTDG